MASERNSRTSTLPFLVLVSHVLFASQLMDHELFFFSNIPSLGLIFHSSLETFGLVIMLLNYAILNFVMGAGLDDFFHGMQLVG
jgi:hypothetical protein